MIILGAVTIRERVKRARIEDPFVVHQFVVFGTGSGAELVLFGIPVHAVCLDDWGDARLVLRRPEFIHRVLLEDLIVELGLSFGVEGETADLTFGFTAGGHVAVVFRSSGTEFNDVVAWVEFIGEIAEKITEWRLDGWIVGSLDEDDGIGVGIGNPRTEMIEDAVEMASGMAGGEAFEATCLAAALVIFAASFFAARLGTALVTFPAAFVAWRPDNFDASCENIPSPRCPVLGKIPRRLGSVALISVFICRGVSLPPICFSPNCLRNELSARSFMSSAHAKPAPNCGKG